MSDSNHARNFSAGQHGGSFPSDPAGQAAYRAGQSHVIARQKALAAEEEARKRRRLRPTIHLPQSGAFRRLSPDDMRQIDAWAEWWFDTDTWFGLANMMCFLIGGLGGLGWAVVSAFATEPTFGSVVLMPIFALFAGACAGALAPTAGLLWLLWKVGSWVVGLF